MAMDGTIHREQRGNWLSIVALAAVSLILGLSLLEAPSLSTPDGLRTVFVFALFLTAVCVLRVKYYANVHDLHFAVGAMSWWFLIFSETALVRSGVTDQPVGTAIEGNFSLSATGEVAMWVACAIVLGLTSYSNPRYLEILFRSPYRWLSVFCVLALISVLYTPVKTYSLVWAFKLCIVLLSFAMWAHAVKSIEDMFRFVRVLHFAFLMQSAASLLQVLIEPSVYIESGRLGGLFSPTGSSEAGGILLLLALTLSGLDDEKRLFYWITGSLGAITMILGAGKTALIAGVLAVIIYFIVMGSRRIAIAFLIVSIMLAGLAYVLKLPIVVSIQNYQDRNLAGTLSGRTELWSKAVDAISAAPLLGHGYVSSKVFYLAAEDVSWEATNMHNSILEVLYNNGIIGLIPLVLLLVSPMHQLAHAIKRWSTVQTRIMCAGLVSLLVFSFVNGWFESFFGGRPHSKFILFLAVVGLSERLRLIVSPSAGSISRNANLHQRQINVAPTHFLRPSL
jgi:O-antigen ligase